MNDKPNTEGNPNLWGMILAGGDGTRLQPLTRVISGDDRPKQFCSLFGGSTLFDETRRRVSLFIPEEQTLAIVTQAHEQFYKSLPPNYRLLVQPANKGTAVAIILGLLRVKQLAPNAVVAIFPSDHYIDNDVRFMSYIESAFSAAQEHSDIIVLGIKAESPEVEYGWIEPQVPFADEYSRGLSRVRSFWEKPSAKTAQELMRRRCLWNSFVMVGRAEAFLRLTQRALPDLYRSLSRAAAFLGTAAEGHVLHEVFDSIQATNFSSQVLALWPDCLLVSQVSGVGWTDLGEPVRALSAIRRSRTETARPGHENEMYRASISFLRHHYEARTLSRRSLRSATQKGGLR